MPNVMYSFSELNSVQYSSTLDLWAGYHHMLLNDTSIPKTTFTSHFWKYEYLKVPSGLEQVPAYFKELMNKVLKDIPFAITYLDDIIIYSKTTEDLLDYLKQVLQIL